MMWVKLSAPRIRTRIGIRKTFLWIRIRIKIIRIRNTDPVTASSSVPTFWVIHYWYIRVQNFFFHIVDLMGIKRRRILRRFQKYKLTLGTNCTKKKLFLKNMLNWDFSWVSPNIACFLGIAFSGAFCR
jgi:hypothetical protein